ncbi:hypothetical protein [Streptomyces sp. NPDC002644]
MAFYLVTDGRKNEYGEADTFVVRAHGRAQAKAYAPLFDPKNATVEKLEDGRSFEPVVIHSSFVEYDENEGSDAA